MAEDRPEEVNPDEAADDAVGDSEEISEVAVVGRPKRSCVCD